MAVKFLSGVNLEGNDVVNVNSIEASSATFARTVNFNDTIRSGEDDAWYIESGGLAEFKDLVRTPKGEISVLDMQNIQYVDSPSGLIVFDMIGYDYSEDNLISGIAYRGDDLAIKNGRDIYFYAHGNTNPELVISDLNSRFAGMISCGEGEGVAGCISILDSEGHEATYISATGDSWIGGNLTVRGTTLDIGDVILSVGSNGLTINTGASGINVNSLSAAEHIGCRNLNVSTTLEFYRNTYIKHPNMGGLEINTDGVGVAFVDTAKFNKGFTVGTSTNNFGIASDGTANLYDINGRSLIVSSATIGGKTVATTDSVNTQIESSLIPINQAITSLQQSTFTGTSNVGYYRLTWFTSSGGARNVDIPTFYGKGFVSLEDALEANVPFMADAAFIDGIYSAIDTAKAEVNAEAKTYADNIYNKLLTNPDETVNSITELLALIESNKDTLIKRHVYEFTGDGTKKTFTCTHNLGTTNLVVTLYDADTNEVIQSDITHTSVDTTQISFANAPENNRPFKLVLLG